MKNLFLKLVAGSYLLVMGQIAMADTLGIYLGAGTWNQDYSGDLLLWQTDALNVSGDSGSTLYVKFEHPVPVLPNIKIATAEISDSGVADVVYPGPLTLNTDTTIDLSHTDLTFYYEIIDTGMDLDLGLTFRKFDGEITQIADIAGTLTPLATNTDITATIPMLYLSFRVDLPLTGFYLGADANALSISGNGFVDYSAMIGWTTSAAIVADIGVEAGVRSFSVKADTQKLDLDLDFETDGVFLRVVAHF